ncbi:hypothetical protein GCM10011445_22120 [Pseudocitrobacter faecalis]|uniref:hypothetical protein n=1 Tax=Pseudocitrobacter faecalis TaxID=1398493 RepID=UPI0016751EB6|nr:hypothetical protein [Pseudocitrobacter faecalis]GHD93741.1 hypothetical protein GCM10011445_22120 [Pseudocitrobacter faecalis]
MPPEIKYSLNKKLVFRIVLEDNFFIVATIPVSLLILLIFSLFIGVPFLSMALGALGVTLVAELLLALAIFLYSHWIKSRTPSQIVLNADAITLDNKTWQWASIESIKLTPNIYPMNKKYHLAITDHAGKKTTWFLGYGHGTKWVIFSEYQSLCEQVAFFCESEPGKFQSY